MEGQCANKRGSHPALESSVGEYKEGLNLSYVAVYQ